MLFLAGKIGYLTFFRSQRSDTAAVALPIYSRTSILSISGSPDFFQIGGKKIKLYKPSFIVFQTTLFRPKITRPDKKKLITECGLVSTLMIRISFRKKDISIVQGPMYW